MTRRILAAVGRVLSVRSTDERLHFHQGAQGTVAHCFDPTCTRPSLRA